MVELIAVKIFFSGAQGNEFYEIMKTSNMPAS